MGRLVIWLASSICLSALLPVAAAAPAPNTAPVEKTTTVQTTTTTVKTTTTTTVLEPENGAHGATSTAAPVRTVTSTSSAPQTNVKTTTVTQPAQALHTTPIAAPLSPAANLPPPSSVNRLTSQGIMSQSSGHQPGIITRALGGVVTDAAHATMALVGTTILNQGIDLPPDDASKPEWPFNEPHRKTMYTVNWTDGSTANISRLPDGSLQILGSGRRLVMQPESGGSFAMFGDFGSMATLDPRPGGGFTLTKDDGSIETILPREGGGFVVTSSKGVIATILPGMNGRHHIIGSKHVASGFLE
ncbi:MAG: hypothetical protein K2X81_24200 [Candidatus Obscuribacterales bacterium]|nr:hypothetical protein [Candidatus Obscuribacterales bacterium]